MNPVESPGDIFAPGADMAEAKRRADIADELGSRPAGQRWRPTSGRTVLVDNRRRDPGAPVQLKTSVFGAEVVTEWRHHEGGYAYHVFEVDDFDATEKTFRVEEVVDALKYHAELEGEAKRREFDRRAAARALRFWQPALGVSPAFAADQRKLRLHPNMSASDETFLGDGSSKGSP